MDSSVNPVKPAKTNRVSTRPSPWGRRSIKYSTQFCGPTTKRKSMPTTNKEVAKQLSETRRILSYMGAYFDWAPLVGVALSTIQKNNCESVNGVAGAGAVVTGGNGEYKLTWDKWGNRLTINHHGNWKSESITDGGKSHHTMARGRITPLHDDSWVATMMERDHGRKYAKRAVKFFQTLLQKSVDTPACYA